MKLAREQALARIVSFGLPSLINGRWPAGQDPRFGRRELLGTWHQVARVRAARFSDSMASSWLSSTAARSREAGRQSGANHRRLERLPKAKLPKTVRGRECRLSRKKGCLDFAAIRPRQILGERASPEMCDDNRAAKRRKPPAWEVV